MGIVARIVLGFMAGLIAKLLLSTRAPHGAIVTILIGITGAFDHPTGGESEPSGLVHPRQRTPRS